MMANTTRRRSKAASRLHSYQNHQNSPVKKAILASPRAGLAPSSRANSNPKRIDISIFDCSISTLGDHSWDSSLRTDSPVATQQHFRWKQHLGNENQELDMPPIGPKRSIGCLDDLGMSERSEYKSLPHDEVDRGTSVKNKNTDHPSTNRLDDESSASTDLVDNTPVETTVPPVPNLRSEDIERPRRVADTIPKPVIRTVSNNMDVSRVRVTASASGRNYGLPSRLSPEDALVSFQSQEDGLTQESKGKKMRDRSVAAAGTSIDTPPSIAQRKDSFHISSAIDLEEEEDYEDESDDDDDDDDDSFSCPST